jgi:hypothetical protein
MQIGTLSRLSIRARNIKNTVSINQDWGNSVGGEAQREIKSLRATISQLRTELAMIRAGGAEIQEAQGEFMGQVGEIVGQTKVHYLQRRDRDQIAEIGKLKQERVNQSFSVDRYHFLAHRLEKKVKTLMDENAQLRIERDMAIAEKCKILHPGLSFTKNPITKSTTDLDIDTLATPTSEENLHPMIRNYVTTISQLRLALSDCEDKLSWQYEAMSKLGQKNKSDLAWSFSKDLEGEPTSKRVEELKDDGLGEAKGERKLLDAIRENIQLNQATKRNDYSLLSGGLGSSLELVASSLQHEAAFEEVDDGDENYGDTPVLHNDDQGPDIYMLINKLQNDIVQHEALAESIQKREAEYNRMQKAYESKLTVLQNQMGVFQNERDMALNKMSNGTKQQRSVVATKYEEAKRRLDSEISDTKRKMGENSRLQSNSKSRAEKLTSELQATISSLKCKSSSFNLVAEKNRMLQELRIQTQKHRDSNNANMREISKLRRKEKNASDIARRLERSNQLQRLMLKKRSQEVVQTQGKLKQIMQSLKRASTPNKVLKSHVSGFTSPVPRNLKSRNRAAMIGPAMNEMLASVNSPVRVSVGQSLMDARPDVDIRAQFKKQMIDKELSITVLCRKTQKTLQQLQQVRNRLIEEQKELIAERKRVIEAQARVSGIRNEKEPQYMDDRVQSIDLEVASIDNSMIEMEQRLKKNSGILDSSFLGETVSSLVDLNWENALNILKSLERIELEATLAYFLEDVVTLRATEEEFVQEIEQKDLVLSNLKQQHEELQATLYAEMKKHRVVNFADEKDVDDAEGTIGETLASVPLPPKSPLYIDDFITAPAFLKQAPRLGSAHTDDAHVIQVEDSLYIPLAVRIPSPTRKKGVRPISLSPSRGVDEDLALFQGRSLVPRKDLTSPTHFLRKERPLSPIKEISRPNSTSLTRKEGFDAFREDQQASSLTLQSILSDEEPKSKKKYEMLSIGGSDVFQRLANAHTRASQAKVIQRNSIDKEAAMTVDPLPIFPELKRKSLSEMEQNWHE